MLDINLIRKDPEFVKGKLALRGFDVDFADFLANDQRRRDLIYATEQLKAERNKSSSEVPKLKKEGKDVTDLLSRMREIGDKIKENDQVISDLNQEQDDFVAGLPNLPADGVVAGGKENNQVIRTFGNKPEFSFEPQHHVDIVEHLGIIDYARGAKLAGAGNWIYRGRGAQLEWALLNYFIQNHLADNYEMILPPHLLNYECGYTAGQFPKFVDDIFTLRAKDDTDSEHGFKRFLLPTSETALVNLHRNEILNQADLPKKYFAYTPCYRSEAGSYRAEERGMIRGHQFNKVEIFQYALPDESDQALEELISKAEKLVQNLGLHYRVSKLAAEDCSASMRETYDIEVWIPSMDDYKEVSSASNAGDYQARRGSIRFRNEETGKNEFIHTLNASGLATSRIFPAIMEQYQQVDGSVVVPEVLRPLMNGLQVIEPK